MNSQFPFSIGYYLITPDYFSQTNPFGLLFFLLAPYLGQYKPSLLVL